MMRSFRASAWSAAVTLTVAPGLAFAQFGEDPQQQQQEGQERLEAPQQARAQQEGQLVKAEQYVDQRIVNAQGQEIGQVEELTIDVNQGRIAYVIATFQEEAFQRPMEAEMGQPQQEDEPLLQDEQQGQQQQQQEDQALQQEQQAAFPGEEGDRYALPWEAFEAEQDQLQLTIDTQQLQQVESFQEGDEPDFNDPQWGQQIHQQLGLQPYWEQDQQQQPMGEDQQQLQEEQQLDHQQQEQEQQQGQQQLEQTLQQGMTQAGVDRQQAQQQARQLAQQFQQEQPERQQIQQQLEQTLTQAGVDRQQAQQEAERLSQQVEQQIQQQPQQQQGQQGQPQVYRYDEVLEFDVVGREDEELGQLDDLVIDTREGRVIYGIVSYGGILGIGEELAPVPFQALQFDREQERFSLDATEQELDQVAYEEGEEPDWQDQQWAMQTHQAFGQEPYWQVFGYAPPGEEREGEPGAQQLEQTLQQGMTQAGVDRQQAQQQARQLAQRFQQEQPERQQIQQQIEQTLTQAGVDREQAQQEAQRLSQQVHQQIQQQRDEPMQRPLGEDEPEAIERDQMEAEQEWEDEPQETY